MSYKTALENTLRRNAIGSTGIAYGRGLSVIALDT